jgi:DNA-binding transcriptional MerR regulator
VIPTQRQFDAIIDGESSALAGVRGHHTVAMMAGVLEVPLTAIRHWVRGGLLRPTHQHAGIDWFDFGELVVGRRLARLLRAGFGLRELDTRLAALHPGGAAGAARDLERIVVDGRRLSLRCGSTLLGAGGQRQLGFYTPDLTAEEVPPVAVIPWSAPVEGAASGVFFDGEAAPAEDELLAMAADLEAAGELEPATEALRAHLQAGGPSACVTFMLAELLYRVGDLTASRERYYAAIELDPDHLEARTGLGCVLAELGDQELAEAALDGVLRQQPDYADAHWHLAGILDGVGRAFDATRHLRAFVALAPDSPWARTAIERLADRG